MSMTMSSSATDTMPSTSHRLAGAAGDGVWQGAAGVCMELLLGCRQADDRSIFRLIKVQANQ
jgi:hypothetical protein